MSSNQTSISSVRDLISIDLVSILVNRNCILTIVNHHVKISILKTQLLLGIKRDPQLDWTSVEEFRDGNQGLANQGVFACIFVIDSEVNHIVSLGRMQQEAPVPNRVGIILDHWSRLLLRIE